MARRLFVTPPTLPTNRQQRCINIPMSAEWLGIFNAALLTLTAEYNFEQVHETDLTPAQVAAICAQIYEDYLKNECGEETIVDVRQNPENPCELQKTYDGVSWVTWADISLCAPNLRTDPATGQIQVSTDGGSTWETVPDAPWPTPEGEIYAPPPSPQRGATDDEKRCNAAANAALGLAAFYQETYGVIGQGFINSLISMNRFLSEHVHELFNAIWSPNDGLLEAELFRSNYDSEYWGTPTLSDTQIEDLKCLLYENATVADGVVSFDFQAVADNVIADLGINPGTAVWSLLQYIQGPGLNSAGGIQAVNETDCSDCGEIQATFYRLGGDGTANMTAEFTNYDAVNDWYIGQYRPEVYRVALPWIHINAQTPILGIYVELEWVDLIAGGNFSLRPGQRLATPEYTQAISGTGSWSGWFMFTNPTTYASCTIEGKVANSSVGQVYIKKFNILT